MVFLKWPKQQCHHEDHYESTYIQCSNYRGYGGFIYDVGGGHSDAGADAKICEEISSDFICIYEKKIAGARDWGPDLIVTVVCLHI